LGIHFQIAYDDHNARMVGESKDFGAGWCHFRYGPQRAVYFAEFKRQLDLTKLPNTGSLRSVHLGSVAMDEGTFVQLGALPALKVLYIQNPTSTVCLRNLRYCPQLESLTIFFGGGIEDWECLCKLDGLRYLTIYGTAVNRSALDNLSELGHLRAVDLLQCGIAQADLEQLRKALPNCQINQGVTVDF
jgi:hypothetical protein